MARPIPRHDGSERVPRTVDGIAAALSGARRMEFYRRLGEASPESAGDVLSVWWCEAMLDADPDGARIYREAIEDSLPYGSWDEVFDRRRAQGLSVD